MQKSEAPDLSQDKRSRQEKPLHAISLSSHCSWCLYLVYSLQKSEAPDLSQDKRSRQEKPLDFLVQQAAVDPATKWRRVYQLGRCGASKDPILVALCVFNMSLSRYITGMCVFMRACVDA